MKTTAIPFPVPVVILLLAAGSARGQGTLYRDYVIRNSGGVLTTVPFAQITVCTSAGTGNPCTPTANVYNNIDLAPAHLITQPVLADANGNFFFFAAPGQYVYSIPGATANFPISIPCSPNSQCAGGSGIIGSGSTNVLPKFTSSQAIGNSAASDTGSTMTYSGSGGISTASATLTGTAPFAMSGTEGLSANCPTITAGTDILCTISDLTPRGIYLSNNGGAYAPIGNLTAAGSTGDIQLNKAGALSNANGVFAGANVSLDGVGALRLNSPGNVFVTSTGASNGANVQGGSASLISTSLNASVDSSAGSGNVTLKSGTGAVQVIVGTAQPVNFPTATGLNHQFLTTNGASPQQTSWTDFPDVKQIPAANCNSATAGNAWSIGAGGTVTCRGGTNNLGGFISITDTSTTFATFQVTIPEDWDSASNPFIRFQLASTDAVNAHTIIPQIQVACYKGDGSTTDDVAPNAAHSLSTVTLNGNANRFWSTSNVQMNSTDMTGCVAGALMQVTVGRATDTATSANFYGATITFPRLLTIQAN